MTSRALQFDSETTDFVEGVRTLVFASGNLTSNDIRIEVIARSMNIIGPENKPVVELEAVEDSHKILATVDGGYLTIEIPIRAEYLSMRRSVPVIQG